MGMTQSTPPQISLILPTLPQNDSTSTLSEMESFFKKLPVEYEVRVAQKHLPAPAQQWLETRHHFHCHASADNKSKGADMKEAVLQSRGQYIFILNPELSAPLAEILKFMAELESSDTPVFIGNRRDPQSRIYRSWTWWEATLDETLNSLVRQWLNIEVSDCYCGFQAFRRDVGQKVYSQLSISSEGYPVEFLWLLKAEGITWSERPLTWVHRRRPRIQSARRFIRRLSDLVKLRGRLSHQSRPSSSPS